VLVRFQAAIHRRAACGGGRGGGVAAPESAAVDTPVNGLVKVAINANSIRPRLVSMMAGEEVTFQVTSVDSYHTFSIDELDVNLRVGWGKTGTVAIIADRPGTYTSYCRGTGHHGFGEEGKLIVK